MKKILSLSLALVLMFTFVGCGKDRGNQKKENDIDIEYYAKLGQIPEVKYTLGTDVETVKSELSALSESETDGEMVFSILEGNDNILIDNGTYSYYYKKATPEKGIGCIVDYDTAYGFGLGAVIIEVKDALSDYEYTEEALNKENAFFMFGAETGTVIECKFEENTLAFVFVDNALCATALYTGSDW